MSKRAERDALASKKAGEIRIHWNYQEKLRLASKACPKGKDGDTLMGLRLKANRKSTRLMNKFDKEFTEAKYHYHY